MWALPHLWFVLGAILARRHAIGALKHACEVVGIFVSHVIGDIVYRATAILKLMLQIGRASCRERV